MNALRPCPFCGGIDIDPEFFHCDGLDGPGCNDCGATAPNLERWNARPAENALAAALNRAREDIGVLHEAADAVARISAIVLANLTPNTPEGKPDV